VLQLIQGSGEFSTFLAQLDAEAARHGVQLDLYEPVAAPAPVPAAEAKKGEQAPPPPASPMEAAGLKEQKMLLTARGSYPSLLAFMRATEKLSVLVSQTNLSLAVVDPAKSGAQVAPPAAGTAVPGGGRVAAKTELKLMLTSYQATDGKIAQPIAKTPD
jgi:type IV pilus assembly protein PilO